MADDVTKKATSASVKRVSFAHVHRLAAAVALIGFLVTLVAGIIAQVRVITIVYRAVVVMLVVGVLSRVLIHVLASYEEMNSGKT